MKKKKFQTMNDGCQEIVFVINGREVKRRVRPSLLLLDLIRDELSLKGTKPGCLEGECGACTVLIDGAAVNSCLYLAINVNGKEVITIEGLVKEDGTLDIAQEAMVKHGAVQCGFCSSGMAMSIKALLNQYEKGHHVPGEFANDFPSKTEIKKWLEGNLCRCTGYTKIIEAAESVFEKQE